MECVENVPCVCAYSVVSNSVILWTVAHQTLFTGFSRQVYGNRLPFPALWDLPNPGTVSTSPGSPEFVSGFFTTEPPGNQNVPYFVKFLIIYFPDINLFPRNIRNILISNHIFIETLRYAENHSRHCYGIEH